MTSPSAQPTPVTGEAILAEVARLDREAAEAARVRSKEQYRAWAVEKLEEVIELALDQVRSTSPMAQPLKAADTVVKAIGQHAKILGYEAPRQIDANVGGIVLHVSQEAARAFEAPEEIAPVDVSVRH